MSNIIILSKERKVYAFPKTIEENDTHIIITVEGSSNKLYFDKNIFELMQVSEDTSKMSLTDNWYVDDTNHLYIVTPETYDNPYGIPDSVYNEIKDESIAEVQSEVTLNDNAKTAATN